MIAIAHVSQRNAVEGEAKLVLVEAADADALRPFIAAERIGRLEIDAGQLLDGFERIGAGRQGDEIAGGDFLDLAGLAAAKTMMPALSASAAASAAGAMSWARAGAAMQAVEASSRLSAWRMVKSPNRM